ncbi:hypothetical protein TOPH_09106 [Tolypocladium ophioglossoides CBS 100239]|uniref:Ribosomal RNA methyltransferase FtsJ domain-containing protein n=1 Tax=Tolypocladium ophioglossoides (strain CBS 100239) TaxID=1163406 RepID=A0A0L0MWM7_TOLOC|nr:hypothetical protein TOPH_09106 [Tolypocladium ophioglossoides CBS 100239]
MAIYFYKLMKDIGQELYRSTYAFVIQQVHTRPLIILDIYIAPGGFLATALSRNQGSRALAFSLPISCGGHKVRLPRNSNIEQRLLDITILAIDMGVERIPKDYLDARNFLLRSSIWSYIIAKSLGNIYGPPIERSEKREVRLFKPKIGHAKRSSFYIVATSIQSQHPEAVQAVERGRLRSTRIKSIGKYYRIESLPRTRRTRERDLKSLGRYTRESSFYLGDEERIGQSRSAAPLNRYDNIPSSNAEDGDLGIIGSRSDSSLGSNQVTWSTHTQRSTIGSSYPALGQRSLNKDKQNY